MQSKPSTTRQAMAVFEHIKETERFFSELYPPGAEVCSDKVFLLELVWALERTLFGLQAESDMEEPEAFAMVYDALRNGDLKALTLSKNISIRRCLWRDIRGEFEDEHPITVGHWKGYMMPSVKAIHEMAIWHGKIWHDQDCEGFAGEIPYIPADMAARWLAQQLEQKSKNGRPRLVDDARRAAQKLYGTPLKKERVLSPKRTWKVITAEVNDQLKRDGLQQVAIDTVKTAFKPE